MSVRGFLRRLWRPALFQGIAFVGIAGYFLLLYVVPPIRFYNIFWLQNFDYGILYNSSQMLAHLQAPFVTTRGTHSWADNQDYFQVLLGIFHHLPYPHYSLLVSHALAIFACGVFIASALLPTLCRSSSLLILTLRSHSHSAALSGRPCQSDHVVSTVRLALIAAHSLRPSTAALAPSN